MFYKEIKILTIIILVSIQTINAYSNNIDNNYNLYVKLPLIPKTKILTIKTKYLEEKNNYKYMFSIKSSSLTNLITKIDGEGYVFGSIDKGFYLPEEYSYSFIRNDKEKFYNIFFDNKNVSQIIINPDYDKNKLSQLLDSMLLSVIDPASMFLTLDTLPDNKCIENISVFDGKRRYDLNITPYSVSDEYIVCKAEQVKIGGFKKKESDLIAQTQILYITYEKIENLFTIKSLEGKNNITNIIIEKN